MKHHHRTAMLATLLSLALGLGAGQAGLFVGDFAPPNWQQTEPAANNPGTYVFTGIANAEILHITGSATPGASLTTIALNAPYVPEHMLLSFSYTIAKNGNDGDPVAYYVIGGTSYALTGTSGTLTGVGLPANTGISFGFSSDVLGGKSPAIFEISGFEFEVVPEVGTWIAGALALGAAGWAALRSRRAV